MINQLNVTNFNCYESKQIEFKHGVNTISGGNHTGKSSIKQAIRFALTGTPDDKKDVSEIIRNVPDAKCEVTVITNFQDQAHTITRKLDPHTLKINSLKLSVGKSKEADGLADYGYKRNVIKMLCDATNFFELTAKEQSELLMNYFSNDALIDVTKYGMSATDAADFGELRASNIKELADSFRSIRTTVNRNIDITKSQIQMLNEEAKKRVTTNKMNLDELQGEKASIEAKIKLLETPQQKPEKSKIYNELLETKSKTELSAYQSEQSKSERIAEICARGQANKAIIDAYKKNAGKCPLSNGKINCHESALTDLINSLEKECEQLRNEYYEITEKEAENCDKFKKDKEIKLEELTRQIKLQEEKLQAQIQEIEKQNKEIRDAHNSLIVKLDGIKIAIHEYEKQKENSERANKLAQELIKLEENSKRYDRYIPFLEKELKEKIVSQNSKGLFTKINEVSEKFGFTISAADGDLTQLRINSKTPTMLSTSERIICGIALQLAVAELSGYNFIIADDLEALNETYFKDLTGLLKEKYPHITSILIHLEHKQSKNAERIKKLSEQFNQAE